MKYVRMYAAVALAALAATRSLALDSSSVGDIVKAQVVIGKVLEVVRQYHQQSLTIQAPTPLASNSGQYLLPYKANGEVTEWAGKAVSAQVGKLVGEKAGEAATRAVASKIPFGGLAGGLIKKKSKELAAVTALGGAAYLKKTSDLSFNDLNDYAVYLHVRHSADANYQHVLATAIAVYPELEGRFDSAIRQAYQQQLAKADKA